MEEEWRFDGRRGEGGGGGWWKEGEREERVMVMTMMVVVVRRKMTENMTGSGKEGKDSRICPMYFKCMDEGLHYIHPKKLRPHEPEIPPFQSSASILGIHPFISQILKSPSLPVPNLNILLFQDTRPQVPPFLTAVKT